MPWRRIEDPSAEACSWELVVGQVDDESLHLDPSVRLLRAKRWVVVTQHVHAGYAKLLDNDASHELRHGSACTTREGGESIHAGERRDPTLQTISGGIGEYKQRSLEVSATGYVAGR